MTTPGVHAIVSTAGQLTPIPHFEIEAIRRVVKGGGRLEPHPCLEVRGVGQSEVWPLDGNPRDPGKEKESLSIGPIR
jgi:hypothetical protein